MIRIQFTRRILPNKGDQLFGCEMNTHERRTLAPRRAQINFNSLAGASPAEVTTKPPRSNLPVKE